jgi:hypothetical protein
MPYRRVIPRDLFNESKLLKCLGQLALILHDYEGKYPLKLVHRAPSVGFLIDQDGTDGSLYCRNLTLYRVKGGKRREIHISTHYNSKEPYPLYFDFGDLSDVVFNDDGSFAPEFLNAIGASSDAS